MASPSAEQPGRRFGAAADSGSAPVVDCFATVAEGDLGTCSRTMSDDPREQMFAVLAGNDGGRASIYATRARLDQLQVGVPGCDRFVNAVSLPELHAILDRQPSQVIAVLAAGGRRHERSRASWCSGVMQPATAARLRVLG